MTKLKTLTITALALLTMTAASAPAKASTPKAYGICKAVYNKDGGAAGHLCKTSQRATVWHAVKVISEHDDGNGGHFFMTVTLKG